MSPHELSSSRRSIAPSPGVREPLTRLVYELLDAHDDTAQIAAGHDLDERWQAHLSYLRDLQRVARELLAHAGQQEAAQTLAPAPPPTQEAGMFGYFPGSAYGNTTPRRKIGDASK
ncbi:MAG TPA: hypothetical protein VMP89_16645 [Solirubrobacteraceae bacterium]|nr:hypothetical protein [Solirubrobacteraceae bacterium]